MTRSRFDHIMSAHYNSALLIAAGAFGRRSIDFVRALEAHSSDSGSSSAPDPYRKVDRVADIERILKDNLDELHRAVLAAYHLADHVSIDGAARAFNECRRVEKMRKSARESTVEKTVQNLKTKTRAWHKAGVGRCPRWPLWWELYWYRARERGELETANHGRRKPIRIKARISDREFKRVLAESEAAVREQVMKI